MNSRLFAVFDGHGGNRCAEYCRQNLEYFLADKFGTTNNIQNAIKEAFSKLDFQFCALAQKNGVQDGSTCVMALVEQN